MNRNKMNYFKSMSMGLAALLVVGAAGCTDGFDSLNTPEHQITAEDVDGSLLGQAFAQAQHTGMLGQVMYQQCYQLFADIYSQTFATTHPNFQSDQFVQVGAWANNCMRVFYQTPAPQQDFVEDFSAENDMPLENALAKIWRVQMYHRITDMWGPIIYSEFGSGEVDVPYDDQETIYRDFFETLDEAVAVLEQNAGGNAFGTHDQMYEGNVDQWRLFANSLRLRLAMRLAYVEPELAETEAEKAVAAGVFESNDDQAMLITTADSFNWISQWTYIREFAMSATMHSLMNGYDDPRLPAYFAEAESRPGYWGLRNGQPPSAKGADINSDHSFVSETYLPSHRGAQVGANPPNRVMNTAEVYFLRAEGAVRGWDMQGVAVDLYNEGIRSSLTDRRPDLSASEVEAYVLSTATPVEVPSQSPTASYHPENRPSPPVTDIPVLFNPVDQETALEQIITQKFIANWYDGWENWSERRRTGYPIGYAIIESDNPDVARDELMRRLTFVSDEISNNSEAVQEAEAMLDGPDSNATRVWWDARPIGEFPDPVD
ncbi:MAG: SusD/RagB family nutrient-binding outer membrane lipoprotein [Balneolaceae bacterium]